MGFFFSIFVAFSQYLNFKECFNGCNKTQGECNWCGGMGGWCCRKVEKMEWIGNGCDGTFGGDSYHACVLIPGLDLKYLDHRIQY